MIWIIGFAIVGFFLGIGFLLEDSQSNFLAIVIPAGVLGLFGFLVALLVGAVFDEDHTYRTDCDTALYAAKDTTGVSGSYFLFGGKVDEEWRFVYYTKDSSGAIRLNEVRSNKAVIFEDADTEGNNTPRLCTTADTTEFFQEWKIGLADEPSYEFHVPPDSVSNTYQFDLEK